MSFGFSILQDYIAVVPEPFLTGSSLPNTNSYSSTTCGVVENSNQPTCLDHLLQISAFLYSPMGRHTSVVSAPGTSVLLFPLQCVGAAASPLDKCVTLMADSASASME